MSIVFRCNFLVYFVAEHCRDIAVYYTARYLQATKKPRFVGEALGEYVYVYGHTGDHSRPRKVSEMRL